jgi:hypothetical protein
MYAEGNRARPFGLGCILRSLFQIIDLFHNIYAPFVCACANMCTCLALSCLTLSH